MRPGDSPPFGPVPERRPEQSPDETLTCRTSSWHGRFQSIRKHSALVMWVALLAIMLLLGLLLWRTSSSVEQPLTSSDVYEAVAEAINAEQPE